MKRFFFLITATVVISACAPNANQNKSDSGQGTIYQKVDITQLQTCSVSNACPSGESCNSYDNSGNAYCYADGHEGDLVGCTSGELIIMQSYPGQVGCFKP